MNFENYLKDCTQRFIYEKDINYKKCTIPWNDKIKTEIINLWKKNSEKQNIVELYTALQLLLQQVVESLVLFDRLYFLKEHNYETNILPIMNKSLSPRCYAIVSKKSINV
jgi:hypothetical protein